jgi:hypothetical protein
MSFLHQPTQVFRGSHRVYNASGSTNAIIIYAESNYQLTMHGIYVGTIVDRTEQGNLTINVTIWPRVLDGGQWHLLAKACAVSGVYPATGELIDLAYHLLRIWDQLPSCMIRRFQRCYPRPSMVDLQYIFINCLFAESCISCVYIYPFSTRFYSR